jgi:hypothetical protein
MTDKGEVVSIGDVHVWIEQGASICIKAVEPTGDPVEITGDQAQRLAETLLKMAAAIE